ncbi:MAG: phage holin family protein [Bacteroidota bacterium]
MRNEEPIKQRIQAITTELRRYFERRLELFAIEAGEHFSRLMAEMMFRMAGILLLSGAFLFAAVALAIFLGEWLERPGLGYLLVSLPVLLVGLLIINLKPQSVFKRAQEQMLDRMLAAFTSDQEPKALPKQSSVSSGTSAFSSNGSAKKKDRQQHSK